MSRRVVGERRRGERRASSPSRAEQRLPLRIGDRRRVAVGVRLTDRGPRPPEVPVVLVVPARDRRVGSREVDHRVEPGLVGGVEAGAAGEVEHEVVPERDRRELPEDGGAVSSAVRVVLFSDPSSFTSAKSSAYAALVSAFGPSERNCDGLSIRNGFRLPTHGSGSSAPRTGGAHPTGRQSPASVPMSNVNGRHEPVALCGRRASPRRPPHRQRCPPGFGGPSGIPASVAAYWRREVRATPGRRDAHQHAVRRGRDGGVLRVDGLRRRVRRRRADTAGSRGRSR